MGRFGQAIAASTTWPSSISARATAYCSLRRKPLVPSTGSSVHQRRPGPPTSSQRSSARRSSSSVVSDRCSRTRARTAPASSAEAASGPKSSSPMRPSPGSASATAMLTSAWAPRSATVTGVASALAAACEGSKSRRTARVSRLAATTVAMAKRRSASRLLEADGSLSPVGTAGSIGRCGVLSASGRVGVPAAVTPPNLPRRPAPPSRLPGGRAAPAHCARSPTGHG